MSSLCDVIDGNEKIPISDVTEYTPVEEGITNPTNGKLMRFVRVKLEPNSKKTYNFYKHYNSEKCLKTGEETKIKNISKNKLKMLIKCNVEKEKLCKAQEKIKQMNEADTSQLIFTKDSFKYFEKKKHPSLKRIFERSLSNLYSYKHEKIKEKVTRKALSLPCLLGDLNVKTINQIHAHKTNISFINSVTQKQKIDSRGNDHHSRRTSFRRKLHNDKKYIGETTIDTHTYPDNKHTDSSSQLKNHFVTSNPSEVTYEQILVANERANNNQSFACNSSQEVSQDLWHLRAEYANRRESEDSVIRPNVATTNTSQDSLFFPILDPKLTVDSKYDFLLDSLNSVELNRKSFENYLYLSPKLSESFNTEKSSQAEISKVIDDINRHITNKKDFEEFKLVRESNSRRQIYRNSLARRGKNQQALESNRQVQTESDPSQHKLNIPKSTDLSQETESSIHFERNSSGSYSLTGTSTDSCRVEDANTSTDSTGDSYSCKLENLRGDSGYKSLENQRSLSLKHEIRSHVFLPQRSSVINEEEPEDTPVLTKAHSAKESTSVCEFSKIERLDPLKIEKISSKTKIVSNIEKSQSESYLKMIENYKEAGKKRIQYKSDRNFVKIKEINTEADSKSSNPQLNNTFKLSSRGSSVSSFTSAFFSRFLKSHSRRTLVNVQRDYSIDERSDALFNEFLRYDPALESKNPSIIRNLGSVQKKYSHRFSTTYRKPLYLAAEDSSLRRYERKKRFSTTDKISDIKATTKIRKFPTTQISSSRHLSDQNIDEKSNKDDLTIKTSFTNMPIRLETPTQAQQQNTSNEHDETKLSHKNIPIIQLTEEED